jgi:hypothetical protein
MAESFRPRAPAGCVADTELLRERFLGSDNAENFKVSGAAGDAWEAFEG